MECGRCRICPVGWERDVLGVVRGPDCTGLGRIRRSVSWESARRIAGDMLQGVDRPGICYTRPVLSADDVRRVVCVLLYRQLLPAALEEAVREGVQGSHRAGPCQLRPTLSEESVPAAVEGAHGMGRWCEGPTSLAPLPVCWQWDVGWFPQVAAVAARYDEVARETRHRNLSVQTCREHAEERAAGWREQAVCGPETSGSGHCRHHHHRPACDGDYEGIGALVGT